MPRSHRRSTKDSRCLSQPPNKAKALFWRAEAAVIGFVTGHYGTMLFGAGKAYLYDLPRAGWRAAFGTQQGWMVIAALALISLGWGSGRLILSVCKEQIAANSPPPGCGLA